MLLLRAMFVSECLRVMLSLVVSSTKTKCWNLCCDLTWQLLDILVLVTYWYRISVHNGPFILQTESDFHELSETHQPVSKVVRNGRLFCQQQWLASSLFGSSCVSSVVWQMRSKFNSPTDIQKYVGNWLWFFIRRWNSPSISLPLGEAGRTRSSSEEDRSVFLLFSPL